MTSFKTHFNLAPSEYEAVRSGHMERRRRELVEEALRSRLHATRRVLEVGFGSGKLLADLAQQFPQVQFLGTEVAFDMARYAQHQHAQPNVTYLVSSLDGINPGFWCDLVYSIDVIHHVHEPGPLFRAIRSRLRTGGAWLIVEPHIYHPYIFLQQERMRRAGLDEDHFRPWALEPLFQQAGFRIASRNSVFLFPGCVQHMHPLLARLERLFERVPFLGGSIVYLLMAE